MTHTQSSPSPTERRLRRFGKWLVSPFFSIGSGVISTVAVSSLGFVAALSLPWTLLLLGFVFLAETAVSIYLFKDSVPDTFVELFIKNPFNGLSSRKKFLLSLGLLCALGGGFTIAALTFTSGMTAITVTLGLISISIPGLNVIVAGILAVFGFIAITSLFTRWLSAAIKNNIHLQIKNYFCTLFTRDPTKSMTQQTLEVGFRLLFVFSIVLLTIIGSIATLGTFKNGLNAFLNLIPAADSLATLIASSIISYSLTGLARLPMAMQSASTVFDHIGRFVGRLLYKIGVLLTPRHCNDPQFVPGTPQVLPSQAPTLPTSKVSTSAKIGATLIHGFSFGALARSGGGAVLSETMTSLHFPISEADTQTVGQIGSMVSGGIMAAGIAAFTFFCKLPPTATPQANEETSLRTAEPSPANNTPFTKNQDQVSP